MRAITHTLKVAIADYLIHPPNRPSSRNEPFSSPLAPPRALREAGEPNQLFPPESGPDIPSLPQCVGVEIERSGANVTKKDQFFCTSKTAVLFAPFAVGSFVFQNVRNGKGVCVFVIVYSAHEALSLRG